MNALENEYTDEKEIDEVSNIQDENIGDLIYQTEYSISKDEAFEGLKKSGIIKTVDGRAILYTLILIVAIVIFLLAYFKDGNINNLIFAVISFVVILIIIIVPLVSLNRLAKLNANGNIINLKIYENCMQIFCNANSWYIPLDTTNGMKKCKNVIILKRVRDNQLFLIPLKAIDDSLKQMVLNTLESGTFDFY